MHLVAHVMLLFSEVSRSCRACSSASASRQWCLQRQQLSLPLLQQLNSCSYVKTTAWQQRRSTVHHTLGDRL